MFISHERKTIEMTKKEEKAAGKIGSNEYKALKGLMNEWPGYQVHVQTKAPAKRKGDFENLTFEAMEKYLKESHQDLLEKFYKLRGRDAEGNRVTGLKTTCYGAVKKWFLDSCPEVKKFREDHKEEVKRILAA